MADHTTGSRSLSIVAAFALVCACAAPAAAQFDKAQLKCRSTIAKGGAKLASTVAKTLGGCHKGRDGGKVGAGVDCNAISLDSDPKGKITKAENKLADAVGGTKDKCVGLAPEVMGFHQCPAPCDITVPAISDFSDVAACVICTVEDAVTSMKAASQGMPAGVPLAKLDAKCNAAIGKNQDKHLSTILKERSKCQNTEEKGAAVDTSTCGGADPKTKIAGARTKGEAGITKACGPVDLNNLDSCSAASVPALNSCVFDDSDALGETIFQALYGFGTPTWTTVISVFANRGCDQLGCHGAVGGAGGLSDITDFDLGYDELTVEGVNCGGSAFTDRVLPGDPANSFLIAKLDGTFDCGVQMPNNGAGPLPTQEIKVISDWILDGAPKN